MTCKNYGENNPSAKKCCQSCGKVLEGYTINNVTGQYGYRNADGTFMVEKYTIQDLADGKCAVKNDGSLNDLRRVLGLAFPNDDAIVEGTQLYYEKDPFGNNWTCDRLTFLPSRSPKHFLLTYSKSKPNSAPESLKQQIDRITKETEDKIQQIVLDHHQQTVVMVSIKLEYCEMTDKLSGGGKTLMPIITLHSTL